jgi:single-strand DNA-binding protein
MANLNKVILIGNLTREPELRVTPGGLSICKFGLAVNRSFTDKDGNKRDETTFVDIDSFGKQAEVISKYMSKGRPILVEGRLKLDQWEDKKTGEKRNKLGVVVEQFQFIGSRADNAGEGFGSTDGGRESGGGNYEQQSPPPRPGASRPAAQDDIDEDVPF